MKGDLERPLNANAETEATTEEDEVALQAVRIANAIAFPMVLKAALELGVIDAMHGAGDGAFLSPSEIARRLPTTKPSNPEAPVLLDRMLRVLTSYSILKCRTVRTGEVERVYGTEPVCRFLLNKSEGFGSVAPVSMIYHHDAFIKTWMCLKGVIEEGGDAFNRAHGVSLFEYANIDEQFGKLFNRAMSEYTTLIMNKVLEIYNGFEGVNVLVDVGGGLGTNLGIIVSKYHHMKGINFDLAGVIANAPSIPGVEHVAGDMFVDDIPNGDAIFMKYVLHDWTDEDCLKILKSCWKALPKNGKVIIVDTIIPEEPRSGEVYSNITFDSDMTMLTQCSGGKERTRAQFQNLATDSGFVSCEFVSHRCHAWVIEFYKEKND